MPSYFPENNTALASDNEVRSLQKIVSILGGGGGGGFGIGTLSGAGSPQGSVSGALGQIYVDRTNGQIWFNTDGATAWGP